MLTQTTRYALIWALLISISALPIQASCPTSKSLDNFEQYDDDCNRIYYSWTDGVGFSKNNSCNVDAYKGNGSGAIVGYLEAPYAEQAYVHGNDQALMMEYNNLDGILNSTVEKSFTDPCDLTQGGTMTGLKLWYQGRLGQVGSIAYSNDTYTFEGLGTQVQGYSDTFQYAYQEISGDCVITAQLDSLSQNKALVGVMVRAGLEADDQQASAFINADGRTSFHFRPKDEGNSHVTTSTETGAQWIRLTRSGNTLSSEYSVDGSTWLPITSDDSDDPSEYTIKMDDDVYIGLALMSGSVGVTSQAAVSNVTIDGSSTNGSLDTTETIGVTFNDPAALYIGLEDASGNQVMIAHEDDSEATLVNYWTTWEIPLSNFSPVDTTAVTKMLISVGDDQTESVGVLYMDDVTAIHRVDIPEMMTLFTEDFEGVELGPNIDESVDGNEVVSQTAPTGWTLDDSGVDMAGDAANGVDEWEGWAFANKDWWASVDDQKRSEFNLACNTVAVADSDEYDDKGDTGSYNTFMSTPAIDVQGVVAGTDTLALRFDSSWRPESSQTATITASFDGASPVEILRWESSGDLYHDHNTNELVTVTFDRPVGAQEMVLTFGYFDASNNWWWAVDNIEVLGSPRIYLLQEDFDSVPLNPNIEESGAGDWVQAWTDIPLTGWTIDESDVPGIGDLSTDGVTEWAGWCIADVNFWNTAAGDQRRTEFTKASGNALIADCDEWDDDSHPDFEEVGYFNTETTTPILDINDVIPGTLTVQFDSSWRPEAFDDGDNTNNQTAVITVSYDGADPIEVLRWESDEDSDYYHDHKTNESIEIELSNPVNAQTAQFTIGYYNAANDWYWAIDNLAISGMPYEPITVLTEDFDELTLNPSVEEDDADPCDAAWTQAPPEGWVIDNNDTPTGGTVEFNGWSFVDLEWWMQIAQEREEFTLASGTIAVADGDEWDDFLEGDGLMNSFLTTPNIDISNLGSGTAILEFDSSWRREDTQTAVITVSYDGDEAVEILRWESEGADTGSLKDDASNEHVEVEMTNPIGAQTAVITFAIQDAGNDWWWAVDNIAVSGEAKSNEVTLLAEDFESISLGTSPEETIPTPELVWSDGLPEGWVRDNSEIPVDDVNDGVVEWLGWHVANKDWWSYAAEDQRRSEFDLAEGAVLIADSDEWDDANHPDGDYNAYVTTCDIDVSSAGSTLTLEFASSWRPEVTQTGTITAIFDTGDEVGILRWESDEYSDNYHDHMTNEAVSLEFSKPSGAQSLVLTFGYFDCDNNWWWAVDNLVLSSNGTELFTEDFEGIELELPSEETQPAVADDIASIWSDTAPTGWTNDRSQMPGIDDPNTDGVTDWAGWAFADKDWWIEAAGDQKRSEFTSGEGTVAVADGDEWDDADHAEGLMNAFLISPAIEIPVDILPETLRLKFDSSWRREDTQTAIITVSYDGGEEFEVLRWESEGSDTGYLKDDATNEAVSIDLQCPDGASNVVITFGMIDAGNDWWWAIDNIKVIGEIEL